MRKIIRTGGSGFRCVASKRKTEHTEASERHFVSDTEYSNIKISLSALYVVYVPRTYTNFNISNIS